MRRPWLWLAAAVVLIGVVLRPWTLDGPMNDDWAYLLTARRLAETGVLRLTDWAPATQVLHIAWGALFIRVFGFHIGWLKLPMLAFTAAASFLLFRLLLEEGASDGAALLAALSLAFNPLVLSYEITFMTDIPYLTLLTAALYSFCRGVRTEEDRWLGLGAAASAAAYLVRQIGLLIPLGVAVELWRAGRLTRSRAALLFLPPLAVAAAFSGWFHLAHGPTLATTRYFAARDLARLAEPANFAIQTLNRLIETALYLGVFAFPLAIGLRQAPDRKSPRGEWLGNIIVISAFWMFAVRGRLPYAHGTIDQNGIGSITMPGKDFKEAGILAWSGFWYAYIAAALAGAWLLAARGAWALGGSSSGGRVLAWTAAFQLLASVIHVNYFDRYMMPMLPCVLGLAALAARRSFRASLATAVLLLFAGVSLAGAIDYAAWNRAESRLLERAWARGLRPERVASSWDWDAFFNYERVMAELKTERPLERIDEWDWRMHEDRDILVTFEPHPETHWRGVELLDKQPYWTPLSTRPGTIYLFKVATLR